MTPTDSTPSLTALPPAVERYAHRETDRSPLADELTARLWSAHERGQRRARELARARSSSEPEALARAEGVDIESDAWSGMEAFTLLGSYADGTITVYERQVRDAAASLPLAEATVRDVVVAHELGHHVLDDTFGTDVDGSLDRLRTVVAAVRGARPRRVRTALSETAAHAFAGVLVDVAPLTHPLEVTELTTDRRTAADRADSASSGR